MTDLQRFILGYHLVEQLHVDPSDGLLGVGSTAAAIADRSNGWYGRATVVRSLNSLCRSTAGNADHEPRLPWARQVQDPGVPSTGPGRQWVATADGAAAAAMGWPA